MHTAECPEEILPSKDAFHWHGQPTKQMVFHLDEGEKERGGKRKEKKREKENLISKLDYPENAKENGGGHVRQHSKKRCKLQSNNPQTLPQVPFYGIHVEKAAVLL